MKNKVLKISDFNVTVDFEISSYPDKPLIINTINAYSWIMSDRISDFKNALQTSDILLPDGVSIVLAAKLLTGKKIKKVAGADLHFALLHLLNEVEGKCFYLGASQITLEKIRQRLKIEYPNIKMSSYSPPFKSHFTEDDNREIYEVVNRFNPDVVFVGMTAPKQETWIYHNHQNLNYKIICGIGAVFDFYAETKKRPPHWMIACGLEWLGRLLSDPKRLWKRYLVYNAVFLYKLGKIYLGSFSTKHV